MTKDEQIKEFEIYPKLYNVAGQVVGAEIIGSDLRIWRGSSSQHTKEVVLISNDLSEEFVRKLYQLVFNQDQPCQIEALKLLDKISADLYHSAHEEEIRKLVDQIKVLLQDQPCSTCGGSGKISQKPKIEDLGDGMVSWDARPTPCPDCKPEKKAE